LVPDLIQGNLTPPHRAIANRKGQAQRTVNRCVGMTGKPSEIYV
jgi:hypothetical protein